MQCYTALVRAFWHRFLIAMAILLLAHYYVWWRLVDKARLPITWHVLGTLAIISFAPMFPLATMFLRRLPRSRAKPIAYVAYTWFGLAVYLLLGAAGAHLAVVVGGIDPRTAALVGTLAALVTVTYGLLNVARGPVVRRVDVELAKLPATAHGYKIVHLTDVHIGTILGDRFAEDVVAKVNALSPDVIVITGDLIDGRLEELRRHVEPLRALSARDGVYACTGNHEYYWNLGPWLEHLGSLGIRVLRNQHVTLRGAIVLAGVDDSTASEDVPAAVAGANPALPLVLLAHHPRTIERAVRNGVDLQLSGHTHGGQLLPLGWLSRLFDPHIAGLAKFGATQLYVSEGTGFWGPPMRVGTVCEIAQLTLVRSFT